VVYGVRGGTDVHAKQSNASGRDTECATFFNQRRPTISLIKSPLVNHPLRIEHHHSPPCVLLFACDASEKNIEKLRAARLDYHARQLGTGRALEVHRVCWRYSDPVLATFKASNIGAHMRAVFV